MKTDDNFEYPDRIKHYLLDYKDRNLEEFIQMFDKHSLASLTKSELFRYYDYVTQQDLLIFKQ